MEAMKSWGPWGVITDISRNKFYLTEEKIMTLPQMATPLIRPRWLWWPWSNTGNYVWMSRLSSMDKVLLQSSAVVSETMPAADLAKIEHFPGPPICSLPEMFVVDQTLQLMEKQGEYWKRNDRNNHRCQTNGMGNDLLRSSYPRNQRWE